MSTTAVSVHLDLDEIAHTIVQSRPDLHFREVRDAVEAVAPRYADATVADFLPVLIEREVRSHLKR